LVATGLFYSGMIYGDDLYDYEKAIRQWEEFLRRFPDHKFALPIYFQLYETYAHLNDMEKSDYYKNLILEQYPNTNYARIIQNPDYYKEVAEKQKESENFYISVYEAYSKKNYEATVDLSTEGLEKYPFPNLAPKFDYLKAISLSKLYGNDTLLSLLPEIIRNYTATEIDTAATNLLNILKKMQQQEQKQVTEENAVVQNQVVEQVYTYNEQNFNFVIILANIKDVKIEPLKGHLNNFNTEFFRLQKFEISSFYIDDVTQMVTIHKFDNKDKAMDYYNLLKTDTKHVGYLKNTPSTKIYVISDANYTTFYRQIDKRGEYDSFFNEHYLK
jgi:tetratricopeptide (TPR) repeat protein